MVLCGRRGQVKQSPPLSSPPNAQLRMGAGTHHHRPELLREMVVTLFFAAT